MPSLKLIPSNFPITMVRGDDFAEEFTFVDENEVAIDVSARTYTAQVRTSTEATTVTATFSVDMTDAATGVVVLRLADTVTDDLLGAYVWDMQQDTAGVVRTLFGGAFIVRPDVTRA